MTSTLYCHHCEQYYTVDHEVIDEMLLHDHRHIYHADDGYHYKGECFFKALTRSRLKDKRSITMTSALSTWLKGKGYDADALDRPGENGNTALMRAALDGDLVTTKALLGLGADVSLKNDDGNQALWLACFSENAELVSTLIEAGCDIDNPNVNGVTSLMYTASSGKEKMTELLLEAGADVRVKSPDDFTALDLAATPKILRLLRSALS